MLTAGFVVLARSIDAATPSRALLLAVFVLGCGMGLSMLSLLLAIQHGVDRSQLGLATSLNQFSRSVGAAVGVAAMGAILDAEPGRPRRCRAAFRASPAGAIPLTGLARAQFAHALTRVFIAGGVMSALGLVASFFLPPVTFAGGVPAGAGEQMLAAEMTSLEPEDEPEGVAVWPKRPDHPE